MDGTFFVVAREMEYAPRHAPQQAENKQRGMEY